MKALQGIDFVKARQWQWNTTGYAPDIIFTASCTGYGEKLTARATLTTEDQVEEVVRKTLNQFADILDPVYKEVEVYNDTDDWSTILDKWATYKDWQEGDVIEVSSWMLTKTSFGWLKTCCPRHEMKEYVTLQEAIASTGLYPDQYDYVFEPRL